MERFDSKIQSLSYHERGMCKRVEATGNMIVATLFLKMRNELFHNDHFTFNYFLRRLGAFIKNEV